MILFGDMELLHLDEFLFLIGRSRVGACFVISIPRSAGSASASCACARPSCGSRLAERRPQRRRT